MIPSQIEFSSFSVSTIEYLFIGQYYSLSDLPIYSDLTKFETYCLLFCGYFEWRLFWQIYIWILLTNAFLMFLSSSEVLAVTMLMIRMSQMSTNPYSWVKFGRIPIQKSCLMASGLAPQSASWSNARLVGWKGRDSAYPHGQWLWVCFLSDCDANSPPRRTHVHAGYSNFIRLTVNSGNTIRMIATNCKALLICFGENIYTDSNHWVL